MHMRLRASHKFDRPEKKKRKSLHFFFFFGMRWQCVSLTWPPGCRAGRQQRRRRSHRRAAKGAWGRRDRAVMRRRAWRGQWPRINCNLYRKWNCSTRPAERHGKKLDGKLLARRLSRTQSRSVGNVPLLTAFLFYTHRRTHRRDGAISGDNDHSHVHTNSWEAFGSYGCVSVCK